MFVAGIYLDARNARIIRAVHPLYYTKFELLTWMLLVAFGGACIWVSAPLLEKYLNQWAAVVTPVLGLLALFISGFERYVFITEHNFCVYRRRWRHHHIHWHSIQHIKDVRQIAVKSYLLKTELPGMKCLNFMQHASHHKQPFESFMQAHGIPGYKKQAWKEAERIW